MLFRSGPTFDWNLVSERAENEAPVELDVVVYEKFLAAFEREIGAVDEVFVETVALFVDVVDLVAVFAIDDDHYVREGVGSVGVVSD